MNKQNIHIFDNIVIIKTLSNYELGCNIIHNLFVKYKSFKDDNIINNYFDFKIREEHFANTENQIELLESIRGKKVYIISTGGTSKYGSVNDNIMSLLLL